MASSRPILKTSLALVLLASCVALGFALRLFGFNPIHIILGGAIVICIALLMAVLYRFYYQYKEVGYARIGQRLEALIFDLLLLHLVPHIIIMLVFLIRGELFEGIEIVNAEGVSVEINKLRFYYSQWFGSRDMAFISELYILGLYLVYSILSEIIWGRTLGKKMVKLSLYTKEGKRPTAVQSIVRNMFRGVVLLPFLWVIIYCTGYSIFSTYTLPYFGLLIYLYPKLNKKRSYVHDDISSVSVIDSASGVVITETSN